MTKKLLLLTTLLLVVALAAFAADITGKWTYETAGRNGGQARTTTMNLKADGGKLTGTVTGGGMGGRRGGGGGGGAATPVEITNGKIDGNNVSFEVKRTTQNGDFVTKYEGTINGDELKLKVSRPGRNGGDPTTTEVTAKRSAT